MFSAETTDSLLSSIPFERITSWSTRTLRLSDEEFSTLVSRLQELEQDGLVDVLSLSRDNVSGSQQVTAVKFVRMQGGD